MATLDELVVRLRADTARLEQDLAGVRGQLSKTEKSAKSLGDGFKSAFGAIVTIEAIRRTGVALVNTQKTVDALESKLKSATGSVDAMRQSLDFVGELSQRLGLDFQTSADAFANFSAAGLRAGVTFDEVKETFEAVAEASTALNLSVADQSGVFQALSQIASKGVVSMEELRQQLGERLPIAFSAAAKGLGITQAELNKLVSSGELMARDFFPAFAKGLKEDIGDSATDAANNLTQNINRMNNAFFELKKGLLESGLGEAINNVFHGITTGINAVNEALTSSDLEKLNELSADMERLALVKKELEEDVEDGGIFSFLDEAALAGTTAELKNLRQEYEELLGKILEKAEPKQGEGEDPTKGLFNVDSSEQEDAFEKQKEMLQQFADFEIKTAEDVAKAKKKIEKDVAKFSVDAKKTATNEAINLLRFLGKENKAFAIAEILLRKGLAISESIINTQVAVTRALALDPTGILAAKVQTQGAIATGLIAATGIAEIASSVSGGGGGSSSGGGFSTGGSTIDGGFSNGVAQPQTQEINLNVSRGLGDRELMAREVASLLNEAQEQGIKIKVNGEIV